MPGHELPLSRLAADQVRDWDVADLKGRVANTCPTAHRGGVVPLTLDANYWRGGRARSFAQVP
jgi:hypothetical protein